MSCSWSATVPVLMITLAETAASRLHQLTLSMTGQPLPVLLNGKELTAPIVREPIAGGVLEISGLQDFRECERLAVWREAQRDIPALDCLPAEAALAGVRGGDLWWFRWLAGSKE